MTSKSVQGKQSLKDLFEQTKSELEEAKQDLDMARRLTENQRLWTEKERDLVADIVRDLSARRKVLVKAIEETKKDQEDTKALRNIMEEEANEASKTLEAVLKEFQSANEALAEERNELLAMSERVQKVHKEIDSRRSQLRDMTTQIYEGGLRDTNTSRPRQCPSCLRSIRPGELYCDRCGVPIG